MKKWRDIITYAVIIVGVSMVVACIERASDTEIEQACQQFVKLQGSPTGDAETEMLTKCRQDLEREKLTVEAAQCRTKAADLDTFWNKCR